MLHALILGFRQLADPAVQRLLLRCVLLTLATFLAGRGDLPADEAGPLDLTLDDFTSGVVAGAAETYQAVAPSLGTRRRRE